MRKKQTFLLTVLAPENGEASFCGKIKEIASGKTFTFTSMDELNQLIASETDPRQQNGAPNQCDKPAQIQSARE